MSLQTIVSMFMLVKDPGTRALMADTRCALRQNFLFAASGCGLLLV